AVWSPDGKYILSYSDDGSLKLWDTEGNVIKKYTGHGNEVYSAAFFPDGKSFATTGGDKTIKIWNLETGLIRSIPDKWFPNFWNAVHINADGKTLMTQKGNGYNEKVFTWDINGKATGKKDAY
ncbi:MAG TPA: hypothetical protein DCQ31_15045, partial [Bacteroidales bacterium]|nr:hypothetical protein [Bacteroidales bacterium]